MTVCETLFPPLAEIEAIENQLTARLMHARQRSGERSVVPDFPSDAWRRDLRSTTFDETTDLVELIDWVVASLDRGIVQMTHPGYLGLFNPAPAYPSECADRIVNAFNPQICVWSHAPVAVEIEQHTIRQVAFRLGFGAGADGHFTSGGSEANAAALICALTAKLPAYGESGISAFSGIPTVYASSDSHRAWSKIAHMAGIGRQAVRLIPTDGQGRLDASVLAQSISDDTAAGATPVMIVATAGTTNGGQKRNESPMAVGCYTPPSGSERIDEYIRKTRESGRFWIAKVWFEGRPVIRVCVTNGRTHETDIDALISSLGEG